MNLLLLLLAAVAVSGLVFSLILLSRDRLKPPADDLTARRLSEFQQEISGLRTAFQDQILAISSQMNDQISKNTKMLMASHQGYSDSVSQVQHRLGELQTATQSMISIGKDIASLQDILRSPKLRGGMGELFLLELLRQILPEDHFSAQYCFSNGTKVDAVITLDGGLIPIDAKFPLENFKRILDARGEDEARVARKAFVQDVKKHIDDISSKYILPQENTFDFAMMYIPAENVYYETIVKDDSQNEGLSEYALRKKVIPVSPNSFYAYLQAIVRGLKGLRIERSAQIILQSLGQLETDFKKIAVDFEKVGSHLSNAQTAYERAFRGFEKLQYRITTIEGQQSKSIATEATSESAT